MIINNVLVTNSLKITEFGDLLDMYCKYDTFKKQMNDILSNLKSFLNFCYQPLTESDTGPSLHEMSCVEFIETLMNSTKAMDCAIKIILFIKKQRELEDQLKAIRLQIESELIKKEPHMVNKINQYNEEHAKNTQPLIDAELELFDFIKSITEQ